MRSYEGDERRETRQVKKHSTAGHDIKLLSQDYAAPQCDKMGAFLLCLLFFACLTFSRLLLSSPDDGDKQTL